MPKSIQDLREQRSKLANEAHDIVNDSDNWNKDSEEKVDNLLAGVDDLDSQIDRHQKVLDIASEDKKRIDTLSLDKNISTDEATAELNSQKIVFDAWLRGGKDGVEAAISQNPKISNVMSTTTDSQGGYTVPVETAERLIETMKSFGGMRRVATVIATATGSNMEFPTSDETSAVGELVAENVSVSDSDPSFGVKNIAAWMYSSKAVAVPFQLLQDNVVDLDTWIFRALATRLHRITNTHFTTGTGTNQPNGVVTASGLGKTGAAGQVTSVIYDDFVDLEHSVDPAYRELGNCTWMMNDGSIKIFKKLKDGNGLPLWMPGIVSGDANTILGYEYTVNQDIAVMAASAKSILFGDFSKYLIRDAMDILMFRMTDSAYTKKGQVGFLSFLRSDGELLDASAVKYYANAAV